MSLKRKSINDDRKGNENSDNERPTKRMKLDGLDADSTGNTEVNELKLCVYEHNKIQNKIRETRDEFERNIKALYAKMEVQASKYATLKKKCNVYCVQCFVLLHKTNKSKFKKCFECKKLYCKEHLKYCEDCNHGFCDKKECNILMPRKCGMMTCDECYGDPDVHVECHPCHY